MAKVQELVHLTGVSVDTVRRDLEILENREILRRVHGGVLLKDDKLLTLPFKSREIKNRQEKIGLAIHTAEYIEEGQTIAINSGTTNIEIAKKLAEKLDKLTVLTNSLKIVEVMTHKSNFTIILPGGILDKEEYSLYGSDCEKDILRYNTDFSIITVNAVSLDKGLTDFRHEEVGIIKAMMKNSDKTILVADSSKFETVSLKHICPLKDMDLIVTDSKISTQILELYRNKNINVVHTPNQ
jgi:DeoR/GlpR family transcriptional regulator of sugar metabolism